MGGWETKLPGAKHVLKIRFKVRGEKTLGILILKINFSFVFKSFLFPIISHIPTDKLIQSVGKHIFAKY